MISIPVCVNFKNPGHTDQQLVEYKHECVFYKITQDFREQDINHTLHSLMFDPVGGGILKCLALFSLYMQGLIAKGAVATKEAPLHSLLQTVVFCPLF
jgi:hypothetical protein